MKGPKGIRSLAILVVVLFLASADTPLRASSRPVVARPTLPTDTFKVIVPAGALDEAPPGLELWHDYGAFALYRTSPAAWERLPASTRQRLRPLPHADEIALTARPFNTQVETFADIPPLLQAQPGPGPSLHLIQFVGPIKAAWLDAVSAQGAKPVHYVANYGYLVWAGGAARTALDALARDGEVVQFSTPYHPAFKLTPTLTALAVSGDTPGEIITVTVQMYAHAGSRADSLETERLISELAEAQLSSWSPILDYQNIRVAVRAGDLATIAARPDVVWVGEYRERELFDEVQTQVLAGNLNGDRSAPAAPGYLAWLTQFGLSTNPTDYPVLDITDDGVGNGTLNSGDPTLHYLGDATQPSRLHYVQNCTGNTAGGSTGGHGHLNASIAGGYDTRAGFPFHDPDGYQRGLGVNPFVNLAGTRIFGPGFDISGCENSYTGLIRAIQDAGAGISSNAWGCAACSDYYDDSSQAYDVGVRDADLTEPGNQALTFIFSAGNSGPYPGYVGTPGNAKNVITVGASENPRPADEDGAWTDGCGIDPSNADHAMDVAPFSSRGPAPGGRVKPELIAPGTHVQGTASPHPYYTGEAVCDLYHPLDQTVFAASSGTSHSAPAVAGAASLYHHWLASRYGITPSPAMLKAYLIAHTTYLTGEGAGDPLPSMAQGYGMPNLSLGFEESGRFLVDQDHAFDNTGETWIYQVQALDPSKPVRIVMAYTDKAGVISYDPRVNDLDLQVQVNGLTYWGNHFSGRWSTLGLEPDAYNNYEAVFLRPGTRGVLRITVTAFNIADDGVPHQGDAPDQDVALVAYHVAPPVGIGQLTGTVHALGSTQPISNAQVTAFSGVPTQTTTVYARPDGTYHMWILSDTYTVTTSAYGYDDSTLTGIAVVSGTTTSLDIPLTPRPQHRFEGYIRDALTGWPLYAEIAVVPTDYPHYGVKRYSDPQTGYYSMTLMGAYNHTLSVDPWIVGYLPSEQNLYLTADTQQDIALMTDAQACQSPGYVMMKELSQPFDGAMFPPMDWESIDRDGNGPQWTRVVFPTHENSPGAVMHRSGSSTDGMQDGWLLTPWLTLPAVDPQVRFWESVDFAIAYHKHSLWLCQAACDAPPTNYVEIAEFDDPTEDAWTERSVDLNAYAREDVRLAFRYQGDFADHWTLDDVNISGACNPPSNGGLMMGGVFDANLGDGILDAPVYNAHGDVFSTTATGDPARADNLYALFAPTGAQVMTATAPQYAHNVVTDIVVHDAQVTYRDIFLDAGWPKLAPTHLDMPVYPGEVLTTVLTLGNGSPVIPYTYEVMMNADDRVASPSHQQHHVLLVSAHYGQALAMKQALKRLEAPYTEVYPYKFADMSPTDLLDYRAVLYAGLPDYGYAGPAHTLLIDYLDMGGALYISDNDLGFMHSERDPQEFYSEYLKSVYTNKNHVDYLLIGENFFRGLNLETLSRYPDEFEVLPGGQRILRYEEGQAAGVAVDAGYRAIATTFDFDTIVHEEQRITLLKQVLNFMETATWLSTTPVTGTIAPNAHQPMTLTLDASAFTQPGTLHGTLHLFNDSPYTMALPVTMTVVAPEIQLTKSAAPHVGIHNGDRLTYTLTFFGSAQNARLWDPLPTEVTYVPDTLTGTVSPPAEYVSSSHAIRWEGAPPTTTQAVVQFQVEARAGGSIMLMPPFVNTAWLRDTRTGLGSVAAAMVNGKQALYLPVMLRTHNAYHQPRPPITITVILPTAIPLPTPASKD